MDERVLDFGSFWYQGSDPQVAAESDCWKCHLGIHAKWLEGDILQGEHRGVFQNVGDVQTKENGESCEGEATKLQWLARFLSLAISQVLMN